MKLPIDFEEKVKQPPAVGGVGGYPYSISAKDLMRNFVYASPIIPPTGENGLNGITEVTKTGPGGHQSRELSTTPLDPGETAGDVLYWDGSTWVPLAAPSAGAVMYHDGVTPAWLDAPSGEDKILSHTGSVPEWIDGAGSGANMNISIYSISENSSGFSGPRTLSAVIYVRGGIVIGTTDPMDTPSALIELSVTDFDGYIS